MLIPSPRHTARDLESWSRAESLDRVNALRWRERLARKALAAADAVRAFAADGRCYAGCSWGKDSVMLAHILASHGIAVPIVWVRVEGIENPDCPLVRDAFLARYPVDYHEVCAPLDNGASRRTALGFAEAARRFGDRHISGVRGQESRGRMLRMASYGVSTDRTCAPIGHWSTAEIFAYLCAHRLPVHPAYAQSIGGLLDRERLRVAGLGGERGRGHGRREWEERYYPQELPLALRAIDEG